VVDIGFTATSWYESLAREMQALSLSEHTPWEERENGFFEYFSERHRLIGVEYLGRWLSETPFYIWVNKEVSGSADLRGMTLRTRAGHLDVFMKSLGINAISVDPGEVYSALERGIVEGFSYLLVGPRAQGWTDSVKYLIDEPFYGAQNTTIIANPSSWAKLSAEQQAQVMKATEEFERAMIDELLAMQEEERGELESVGVTFIKFAPDDARAYTAAAYAAGWSVLEEQTPELVEDIKRVARK
jgi:TRAP-type C4-dicarboxylate transport system substrate-binding protein